MKYLLLLFLTGCATVSHPTNECRISILDGNGRYGTITQFVKGKAIMVRVVQAGKGCSSVKVERPGIKVEVNE